MQMIWFGGDCRRCVGLLNRHRLGRIFTSSVIQTDGGIDGVNTARTRMLMFAWGLVAAAFAGMLASLQGTLLSGLLWVSYPAQHPGGSLSGRHPSVFGGVGTILGTFIWQLHHRGHRRRLLWLFGLTGFWTELIYGP